MLNQRIVFALVLIVLILACLLGGGQGFFGDVLAQLAASILLMACLFNRQSELKTASGTPRLLAFSFVAIIVFVPLLQLCPWPNPNAFTHAVQQDLQQSGVQFSGASLNKAYGAERALFSLLPAIAIFIACLQLPGHYRHRLLVGLGIIVALNILMGFAQLGQGKDSPLRFYEITNLTEAVGFFANRNHFASLLMMYLPIVVVVTAWWAHQRASGIPVHPLWIIGGALFCIVMMLAIAIARSRGGLLLGALGVLLSAPAVFALPRRRGMKRLLSAVLLIGLVASIQFGLLGILQRFDHGVADNTRTQITTISIEAGKAYAPMGSGLGTFRQAYAPFEVMHDAHDHAVTNHAHNDYAELWLEAGYPGVLAMLVFLILFLLAGFRVWRAQKHDSFDVLLARTAWLSAGLVLLHSLADYPLRTTAISSVLALMLAIALMPGSRRTT